MTKKIITAVLSGSALILSALLFSTILIKNSTINASLPTSEVLSSHISKSEKEQTLSLLFLGDIMLDRYIRQVGEKRGYEYVFGNTKEVSQTYDVVIGNLEGPVTTNPSKSVGTPIGSPGNYIFTFDPHSLQMLKNHVDVVNLGNNHILNFGAKGYEETKQYLEEANIAYFGDVIKTDPPHYTLRFKNKTLTFISYNQFHGASHDEIEKSIEEQRSVSDLIVVYTHWGNEYQILANATQQTIAHGFVDAGADLVIGSHPHVVQNNEYYNNTPIYYSLGNFIFDQYFQENVKEGLAVGATFDLSSKTPKVLSLNEYSVKLSPNGQTTMSPIK